MEILKGMVREKGFEDKECTYMKTDDGKQFYFIENFQLSNGNIIACSDLSQGVGNKPRQTLGVITPRGEIVIPFENKMIKPLENNLLLVERNIPITPNVANALAKKDDPNTATNYMNDANTIKNQLKSVMTGGENYVFDNPFSEAALYTLEGVNVGGNYFSFISKNGNDYFLSTNVVGSSILKYDSSVNINGGNTDNEVTSNNQENALEQNGSVLGDTTNNTMNMNEEHQDVNSFSTNQIGNENSENSLSQEPLVPNIEIPLQLQQQVEDTISKEEVNLPSVDSSSNTQDTVDTPSDSPSPSLEQSGNIEESSKTELNIDFPLSDALEQNNQDSTTDIDTDKEISTEESQNNGMVDIADDDLPNDSKNKDETSSESDNTNLMNEDTKIPLTDQVEENISNEGDFPSREEQSSDALNITDDNMEKTDDVEASNTESEEDNVSIDGGISVSENADEEDDGNNESTDEGGMKAESLLSEELNEEENSSTENNIENEEMEEESYEDYQEDEITNPVIIDATNTIRKLLEENRKQREIIDRQDSEIETLASSNSILKENNDSKSKEIISLRNNMAKYRNQNSTLSRENNNLKATNTRQEELIDNLKSQNLTLKEQVAGITALGNAVKEATTVIETHQEDFSQPSELSYLDTAMGEVAYQKRKTV